MSPNPCRSIRDKPSCLTRPMVRLLTFLTTFVCSFFAVSCARNSSPTSDPDVSYTNRLPTHSLEQRRQDLVDLLTDAEHNRTSTKKDVESRMGRPHSVEPTGSKQFEDRVILTTYRYDLAAGEYTLVNSQKVFFRSGGWALICFDERTTYGSDGRPYRIRDDTAPLVHIELEDASDMRVHLAFKRGPKQTIEGNGN
jgi:hypothetical protein